MNVAATTVTVTATCVVDVYDQQAAQTLATRLLMDQARNEAPGYGLVGNVYARVTVVAAPSVFQQDQQYAIGLSIAAKASLLYQFSATQQAALSRAVAGRDVAEATRLLKQMAGVREVSIAGVGGSLPTDATQIRVVVENPVGG
jgi:hypothetical protein